jgi:beta-glucanase (GH16 family)
MPAGAKGWAPWAALWLYANARQRPPFPLKGQHYEIDVHEGFGNSDWIASNLHWDAGENTELQAKTFVNRAAGVDLSTGFHIFGCLVTATQVIGYFDGAETGRAFVPAGASSAQPLALMLDVSAGLPWSQDLPAGGPYDMTVRYVRVFAPDSTGIVLGANSQ